MAFSDAGMGQTLVRTPPEEPPSGQREIDWIISAAT